MYSRITFSGIKLIYNVDLKGAVSRTTIDRDWLETQYVGCMLMKNTQLSKSRRMVKPTIFVAKAVC